ncbi:hypothetical protein [Rhodococcus sp. UNC363MFTsu5.1]|uniref:hypothetical protein n=1 Tax=Rhodococcus sp. UNC363MFTsu5.1 TaxID=1449069 RepID=UPI000487DB65|nr:hypothetical protein [Rhodococcus sp. UNC363MFTsu5.1]
MLRTLARRGASVLVASALLGGGLALGGGTASAEEAPGGVNDLVSGSVDIVNAVTSAPVVMLLEVGRLVGGSSDSDSVTSGCNTDQDATGCPSF